MKFKLVPEETNIPFTRWRMVAFGISTLLLIASIGLVAMQGLNLGVDFKGGVTLEVTDTEPMDIDAVRDTVRALGLGEPQVQSIEDAMRTDEGLVITLQKQDVTDDAAIPDAAKPSDQSSGQTPEQIPGQAEDQAASASPSRAINLETEADPEAQLQSKAESAQFAALTQVKTALSELLGEGVDFPREEVVGPTVSGELIQSGVTAIILAIGMMLVYIWLRFEWQFSVGAILALAHDITLTLGVFALTRIEFNLPIIAALLTIVGYSMNDTVVVYDRVRENLRKYKKKPLAELLDLSINETLARTVMTSVTTLLALVSLYFLGGDVLRGFTFAMIWGVIVGTYSSIFVASPLLLLLGVKRDWSNNAVATSPAS